MTIIGTRVLRKEDPLFLTTGGTYTADLDDPRLDDALHATFVRSFAANGTIIDIDADGARAMPGVVLVLTGAELDLILPGSAPMFPPDLLNRPVLARDRVRFVGEPVAVILSEARSQGQDAADMVFVDIDPLDAVTDLEEAAADTVVVHEGHGTNTALTFSDLGMATGISDDSLFADCEVVVRQRVVHPRMSAAPLEVRSAAASWTDDRLSMFLSTQAPHRVKETLVRMYGLASEDVHVITSDVGGGFGAKVAPTPEDVLIPHLSRLAGRPVRWLETRTENMIAAGPGRAQVHHAAIGGTRDGDVTHYRLDVLMDAGAYTRVGAFLPFFTLPMAPGTYDIANIETQARSIITNAVPTEAFRGAGRPEATLTIERMFDLFAARTGIDPIELRRRNLIAADAFPVTTAAGSEYDSGDYEAALDKALEAADYARLRSEQAARRASADPVQIGIGVANYVEITAGPAPGGNEFGKVEITPEGRARVYSGALSHGQGHATTFAMIAAEKLGLDISDIEVIQGDTDRVERGEGTLASRSTQLGGSAVLNAAETVADAAREIAAELLEAAVEDVVLDTDSGVFHVSGTPAVARTWAEVAAAASDGQLVADADFNAKCTYPFGTHVAVVEVDTETGEVELKRLVSVDDAGTLINPMIVEGQRHGGMAQGVAQALLEEIRFDEDGNPVTSNFADYSIISAAELPPFELVPMETPTPNNPLGAKGIGESGAIGSTPAVQSAVVDALSHLGVRHIDIPLSPQKVWSAISGSGS
ncbi:MAG: xanthine dehydrogenase family protein molybdopterin-binding subunit [Acidimicrobiaceae bacterium]|nr:xanthine dehydrogenase family protein molybdopterin-binding subunit [Acidimicrobiaceae bacterium]